MGPQGLGPEGESVMCDDAVTASARRISCMLAATYVGLSTVRHRLAMSAGLINRQLAWLQLDKTWSSWHCSQDEINSWHCS